MQDLVLVDPGRGETLSKLQELVNRKNSIMMDESPDEDTKAERVNSLEMDGCLVEDLCLTFQYSPSSGVYQYEVSRLIVLDPDNIENYLFFRRLN